MAKLIGPLHSTEARGRVDSLVYNTWRGIRYVKRHTPPTQPMSDIQELHRIRFANVQLSWAALTDAQRAAWHTYAQQHPVLDWTGVPKRLSGHNWFMRCGVHNQAVYLPIPTDPPDLPPPPGPLWCTARQAGYGLEFEWGPAYPNPLEPYWAVVWRAGPVSLGATPRFEHAAFRIYYVYGDLYGAEGPDGDGRYAYWIRGISDHTGLVSPWVTCQVVYTSP
jgi:hypothetical protein